MRRNKGKHELKHRQIKRKAKGAVALMLIICMTLMSTLTASALTESNKASGVKNEEEIAFVEKSINEDSDKEIEDKNLEEENSQGFLTDEEDEDKNDDEDEEEPEEKKFTVTYDMGPLGTKKEEVEEDGYPENVPEPELDAARFLGWYVDGSEGSVQPSWVRITADATFKARFERKLGDIVELSETDHKAYISGFDNGMFKPSNGITRAQTAQIFYTILKSQDYDKKTFTDVPAKQWYAEAVGVCGQLGIVGGYTDGRFHPTKNITRAEFVKMAASLDMDDTQYEATDFKDVPSTHWASEYIAAATAKGWISGYTESDGSLTFRPNNQIKREEAVTIVNRILGRYPDQTIKVKKDAKNFYDVYNTNWAYGQIVEAATDHTCESQDHEKKYEVWGDYTKDTKTEKSRWIVDTNGDRYYLDGSSRKFVRGVKSVDGIEYLFDSSSGKAFTGWKYVGSWKRYYKNGRIMDDISKEGVVSGPYYIKVYKPANYLIVFAKDGANGYTIPVKSMITSCGNTTPTGTYYTPNKYRWLRMEGYTWAQWCTQIQGNYLFHSVPNWTYNNFDLEVHEYNQLGTTRSLGCIRLTCADAKWVYDNCSLGTQVFISAVEKSGPLKKPTSLKIPSWHTWDPTDPTAYYMCQRKGCH